MPNCTFINVDTEIFSSIWFRYDVTMYKFIRCRRRIFSRYLRNHFPMLFQANRKLGHLAQPPRSSLKLLLNSSRATLTRRPSATSSAASSITGSFQKTGNFTDGPLTSYPRVTSSSIHRLRLYKLLTRVDRQIYKLRKIRAAFTV